MFWEWKIVHYHIHDLEIFEKKILDSILMRLFCSLKKKKIFFLVKASFKLHLFRIVYTYLYVLQNFVFITYL